jgi:hypothetical protein
MSFSAVSIGLLLKRTPLALIRDEVQESLTLDYKRSSALGKWNTERNNLSKDISAFANSEGGMLIYGNGGEWSLADRHRRGRGPVADY